MHASHQPAAANVAGGHPDLREDAAAQGLGQGHGLDGAGTAAESSMDPLDPRRLSFISFADVLHAEHEAHHPSPSPLSQHARSPSPAPASLAPGSSSSNMSAPSGLGSQYGGFGSHSSLGVGLSDPGSSFGALRRGSASIASPHAHTQGDLTIETMAQSLEQPIAATSMEGGGGVGRERSGSGRWH